MQKSKIEWTDYVSNPKPLYYSPSILFNMPLPKDPIKAEQWRQKQRVAQLGKSRNKGKNNPFYGKHHSPSTIELLREKNIGTRHTAETKAKISKSHLGMSHPSPRKGKSFEEIFGEEKATEIKERLSKLHKGKKYRLGIPHTQETKEKISKITRQRTPKGENNPRWKGGVTVRYVNIFNSNGYVAWRKDIFKRDNYTCQVCGDHAGHNLEAHHKISVKTLLKTGDLNLIYDVSNGITLCEKCHKERHKHATIED